MDIPFAMSASGGLFYCRICSHRTSSVDHNPQCPVCRVKIAKEEIIPVKSEEEKKQIIENNELG